jgi:hypothetical protein
MQGSPDAIARVRLRLVGPSVETPWPWSPRWSDVWFAAVADPTPNVFLRFWLAFACFFRVIFDPRFAASVSARPAELPAPAPTPALAPPAETAVTKPSEKQREHEGAALELLALLQREGRLVDFLEQDIASFSDADVGTAARVVHEGCRKALRDHAEIVPVRDEAEGTQVNIEAGYDPTSVKLVGDVRGKAPYSGVLRHRGWRARKLSLPVPVDGHDERVLAPAEVEL